MLPLRLVQEAVSRGVSLVCATCERFREGHERGLPQDRCSVLEPCSGPFSGSSFPHYEGPLTDFSRWCLRCGDPSSAAVRVAGASRAFGLCLRHLRDANALVPEKGVTTHVLEVIRPDGIITAESTVRLPRPFTRKGLTELIEEVQAELEDRSR